MRNNKLILRTQQTFKSERHNIFSEEINKIAEVEMMIKKCTQLIQQKQMHMEQAKI